MSLMQNFAKQINFSGSLQLYRRSLTYGLHRNYTCLCTGGVPSGKSRVLSLNRLRKVIKRDFRQSKGENEAPQPRQRRSLTPIDRIHGRDVNGFRDLIKPLGFTVAVSGVCFAGASVWQYESLRKVVRETMERGHGIHRNFYAKAGTWRMRINNWWNSLGPGQQVAAGIIGVNLAVFALWRIPALTHHMYTYFACSPFSAAPSISMLGSMFSHHSVFHLAANMYVLWSFTPAVTSILGKEQFLAVYVSAGLISALVSHAHKIARFSMVPSLGASGAIMAILGIVCSHYPNSRLSIAFVDQLIPHSFSAGSAMKFIIVMDSLGVLLRWRLFDHAAHLGGMLFGLWYVNYGHKYIWGKRDRVIRWWHKLRGPP